MRGKVDQKQLSVDANRITPAYAGKSERLYYETDGKWDHPRLCGEKLNCRRIEHHDEGSPPPMRGKVSPPAHFPNYPWITPAYAGKSLFVYNLFPEFEDHPRLCGEKMETMLSAQTVQGSPPPMRGKGKDYQLGDKVSGITPAYAGKRPHPSCRNF